MAERIIAHEYPPGEHLEGDDGKDCWCRPELLTVCDCIDVDDDANPVCETCDGEGVRPATTDDIVNDEIPLLVVHN